MLKSAILFAALALGSAGIANAALPSNGYPPCSRTVTDSCTETATSSGHHMAKHHAARHHSKVAESAKTAQKKG